MPTFLDFPCSQLPGVGPKTAHRLAKCGLYTWRDLLFHFPSRYENRTQLTLIKDLRCGLRALIRGRVQLTSVSTKKQKGGFTCKLVDETADIQLRFFRLTKQHYKLFQSNRVFLCFGEIRRKRGHFNELEMIHPEYEWVDPHSALDLPSHLTSIYPSTHGLSQRTLHKLIHYIVNYLYNPLNKESTRYFPDYLPKSLRRTLGLPSINWAFYYIHSPPPEASIEKLNLKKHAAQQRLIFEELLAYRLTLEQIKKNRKQDKALALHFNAALAQRFQASLNFSLTTAQKRVIKEIEYDMGLNRPMQRLLQGEVGSGKTVIAAFATLQAVSQQQQVALMVPTELLGTQHYQQFRQWFMPFHFTIVRLDSRLRASEKKQVLRDIATGKADIIIGTQALFQKNVQFSSLSLIIIDEQHRFGVAQRLMLWEKSLLGNRQAHQLCMTATPIPRTLALTRLSAWDFSFLDELPSGRIPVKTVVLSEKRRFSVIERIRAYCRKRKQVYWVCPLIEASDVLHCQAAAETTFKTLKTQFHGFRLGLLHGRLPRPKKEEVMKAFQSGKIDILIATSVIEVGIDVPQAHIMVIENAERLGLAQLHQLRGRVGRGSEPSFCILLYQSLTPLAKKRLNLLRERHDGFSISQHDLRLRGAGEMCGVHQSGWKSFHIADLTRDNYLDPYVETSSKIIREKYPGLVTPLINRWIKSKAILLAKS